MRIAVIVLMIYYSFGTLFFPMGDLSYALDLPDMYHRCSDEDPDITPADFVFEHLLNLEDVMAHFENGKEEEHEKPHQVSFSHGMAQVLIITSTRPAPVLSNPAYHFPAQQQHPVIQDDFIASGCSPGIFRPPIV